MPPILDVFYNINIMRPTTLFFSIAMALTTMPLHSQDFDKHFADSTLRLDYIFGGKAGPDAGCTLLLDRASRSQGWAGRRHNLSAVPLRGNGRIVMTDAVTADTLYVTSFSTLFQEWYSTSEATRTARAFENTFLVPVPKRAANVSVELWGVDGNVMGSMTHTVEPSDILIADMSGVASNPHRYIHKGGEPSRAIDVAILAEGYTAAEADKFYRDAETAVKAILSHEPFSERADDFNFVAVAAPSADSGVSVPRLGEWKSTAVGSNFSTFYADRYLTTGNVRRIHDALAGIPYEHVVILANTNEYGGGGIYNFYTLTTAGHSNFKPVVVHEFGHSFGGLGDEYFYEGDDMSDPIYIAGVEPWEPNLTTLTDFASKWQDLLAPSTPVPTPVADAARYPVGVYEGGGYQFKGVYRPADDCRMRTNTAPAFCPACTRAIDRLIDFYVK